MDLAFFINILILVISLFFVIKGADWFLDSVTLIGKKLKMSPFLIGVILVGFGTSLPELATSVSSIVQDTHNLAIANIIGSNIANILLVLGLSTFFIGTIKFKKELISLDLPYLFATTALFIILIADGNLNLTDGIILLIGFVIYLIYSLSHNVPTKRGNIISTIQELVVGKDKKESDEIKKESSKKKKISIEGKLWVQTVFAIMSIAILALAARLTVESVLNIAQELEVSIELVTFLTIALGTSLPELLVSFKALKKNQGDLVLGNIIGSSMFNILLVGGVAGVIHEQVLASNLVDWSIFGLALATLIIVVSGITKHIHAWEGATFVMIYVVLMLKIANI